MVIFPVAVCPADQWTGRYPHPIMELEFID